MRKILSFLPVLILAFSLSGCMSEEAEAPQVVVVEEEYSLPVRERAGERLSEIQKSGVLIIGISPDYAPFTFRTEDDEDAYAGSDIELGKYIAQKLGAEAVFVENGFEDCLRAVETGEVDMVLLGMLEKPERSRYLDFTEGYYCPGKQVVAVKRENAADYPTPDELAGKTVAAQYGSLQAQLIVEQLPESHMELTDNAESSVALVLGGQADAAVLDEAMAAEFLKEYTGISLTGAELVYEGEKIVGGVVREETELLKAVNDILKEVTQEKLYYKWLDAATEKAASMTETVQPSQATP